MGRLVPKFAARLMVFAALALTSCGSPTEPSFTMAQGWWTSTTGLGLQVNANAVLIYWGCGHGTFPTPRPDRNGAFAVDGTFAFSVGPPPPPGTPEPAAHYSGVTDGRTVVLTIVRNQGSSLGPATFFFDGATPLRPITPPCP